MFTILLAILPATLALPVPVRRSPTYSGRIGERGLVPLGEGVRIAARQGIDPALVPEFGVQPGVNPDGTGNCEGISGKLIPCSCPPDRTEFLNQLAANVAAGAAVNNPDVQGVSFPTGDDVDSALTRFNAATVTLQNLQGPGIGCPQVATTWAAQVAAIQATGSQFSSEAQAAITAGVPGASTSTDPSAEVAPAAPAPAPEADTSTEAAAGGIDPALVPEFGVQPGVNPDGTGNCEGIGGKLIPCSCPPDRTEFINQLAANVGANAAVNNPDVQGVSFPTGDDVESALTRFNAATVTLQNLQGPGVGCPQVATTWAAQIAAIQATGSQFSAEAQAAITAGVPGASTSTDTSAEAAVAAPVEAPVPEVDSAVEASAGGIDPALVPEFGVTPGANPDGTGNCEGIDGKLIPCSCPPDRTEFLNQLAANVAAGAAVNNPDVQGVSFPTGDDVESALTRFNAATVTLQNLQGPGVGCPQVATTWAAQIAAIQATGSQFSAEAQAAIQP